MESMLITQLLCAFAPALLGLAIAAITSPRMFRLVLKLFQFDLTSALLLMAAFAVLFAMNRAMRDMSDQARAEHLQEMEYARQSGDLTYDDYHYYYDTSSRYDYQIAMLAITSIFTVPCLIFARLVIDNYRDERRSRAEKRQRKLGAETLQAITPKSPPEKPQWID